MDPRPPLVLEISAARVRWFYAALTLVSGVLILATLLSDLQAPIVDNVIGKQLDLKLEGNTAVWFSSFLLLVGGAAACAISQSGGQSVARRSLWMVVALFFAGLSIDETAELHEAIGRRFTAIVGTVRFLSEGTVPAFGWLLALLPLIAVFIAVLVAALRAWPGPRHTRALSIAGLACWIGALFAELVQAQLMRLGLSRSVEGAVEEGFELVGALLFVISFVDVVRSQGGRVSSAVPDPELIGGTAGRRRDPTPWPASRSNRTIRS